MLGEDFNYLKKMANTRSEQTTLKQLLYIGKLLSFLVPVFWEMVLKVNAENNYNEVPL